MDTTNSSNESLRNNTLGAGMVFETPSHWGFWVKFVVTPIIVSIGIVGNTLSLIVMRSKTLRHKSYSHYLCVLAGFDTVNLITRQIQAVDEYFVEMHNTPGVFQNFNNASCKVYNFVEHVSYLMSSWLVMLMAIERLIAVCFPFRKMLICKQAGAVVTICVLFALISVSQVFRLTMIEHIEYGGNPDIKICSADTEATIYTSLDVYFYQWTLAFVIPLTTILICNSLVLYQVIKVRREIKQNAKYTRNSRGNNKTHRTTCMLLMVSFTFLGTLLPLLTLTIVIDISIKVSTDKLFSWRLFNRLRPFLEISMIISLLNYAINFFIYILSGRCFRYELLKLCRRKQKPKRIFTARSTREEFVRL